MEIQASNNDRCKVEIITNDAEYEVLVLPNYETIDANGTIKYGGNLALKVNPLQGVDSTSVFTVTAVRNGIEENINIESGNCYINNIVTDITIKIELKLASNELASNELASNVIVYHIEGDVFIDVYSSESDTQLMISSKPHFIFHGWYDNVNYNGQEIRVIKAGSNGGKVFYGYYEAIVYILTLNVNGGEQLSDNTFEMTFSESIYYLPVPKRIGYEFLGWFSSSDGGTAYTDSNGKSYQVWREGGDRTFYAHWKSSKYNVTLDTNEGEALQDSSIEVEYNQSYTLPIPVKVGYRFLGWYTDSVNGIAYTDELGNSIDVWSVSEDVVLYAHWEYKYRVTLDPNGGTLYNNIKYVEYNQIYILPIPYRRGYKFLGWYSESINGKAYTDFEGNGVEIWNELGNVTLYAHWEAKEYEVKLNINHSACDIRTEKLTYGQNYNLGAEERTGYNFKGWYSSNTEGTAYTDADGKSLKAWDEATNSKTLYAQWEPKKYTISFELNYIQIRPPIKVTYGKEYYLINESDRPGYWFLGWFNSEGVAYTDSRGCCFEAFHDTQDITLYAHWKRRYYKITFEKNWGDGNDQTIEYTYASNVQNIEVPTRSGYTFLGYYSKLDDCPNLDDYKIFDEKGILIPGKYNADDDLTVYARWEENKYTIKLDKIHFDAEGSEQIATYTNIPVTKIISYDCGNDYYTWGFTRWAVIIGGVENYNGETNTWRDLFFYTDIAFTPLDIIKKYYPKLANGQTLTVRAVFTN